MRQKNQDITNDFGQRVTISMGLRTSQMQQRNLGRLKRFRTKGQQRASQMIWDGVQNKMRQSEEELQYGSRNVANDLGQGPKMCILCYRDNVMGQDRKLQVAMH